MMDSFCTLDCEPPPPTRYYRDMVPAPYIGERIRQTWEAFYEWEDENAWQEYMECYEAFGNLIDNYFDFETIDWEILLEEWYSENEDSEIVFEEGGVRGLGCGTFVVDLDLENTFSIRCRFLEFWIKLMLRSPILYHNLLMRS